MVQRMVLKTQEKCIYEIEDKDLKFYLLIPNIQKVFLTVYIMEGPTDLSIQKIMQDPDKVLVIPVLESKLFSSVLANQTEGFNYLDKYVSSLINLAHQILVYNHVIVENVVYFNSPFLPNFEKWLIQKYQGRVVGTVVNYRANEEVSPAGLEGNVVDHTMTLSNSLDQDVSLEKDLKDVDSSLEGNEKHDFGFVSYVLLGVVVAVVSLVFLYLLI